MEITIRSGRMEDANIIAQVIAMAIGDTGTMVHYCGENFIGVLEEIAQRDDSQYSYRNAIVAEVDGRPAGAIIAYDGAQLYALRERTLAVIHRYNPEFRIVDDETEAGEYYLDSIGVLPEYRGLGIGRKLLLALKKEVARRKHPCIGLLVDPDNGVAERLYESVGFRRIGTRLFIGHDMWHMQCEGLL